jgi:hypothetical protein
MMNTAEDLKKEFNARYVHLKQVTEKYLGWTEDYTRDQASKGLVPFRTFKAIKSHKAPWLVDVIDLAEYMQKMRLGA